MSFFCEINFFECDHSCSTMDSNGLIRYYGLVRYAKNSFFDLSM